MAEQTQGTVVAGEYGNSLVSGPADRPEDPSKWKVVKRTDAEICKRINRTMAQLEMLRAFFGFPRGQSMTRTRFGSIKVERYTVTNERDVQQWEERAREAGLLK